MLVKVDVYLVLIKQHKECLKLLLDNGALTGGLSLTNINEQDTTGATPLFSASSRGHKDCMEILIV